MKRHVLRALAATALLLLLLGSAAPFFHADRYRSRIQTSLSAALGRRVEIGEVRLDLFTGPGFSVSNVVISDSPAGGGEPFAYIDRMKAAPRLFSLWTGHLEFSSLVLDGAHLNVARASGRSGDAHWNFESLLSPNLFAAFPSIRIRGGRINFKFENRKSPFYLLNADLDVSPRLASGSDWALRFTGEAARTDRSAHGFGTLAARGRWLRQPGTPGHLELDVNLQKSEIGDLVSLLYGHDAGVYGTISGKVHAAGGVRDLGLEGEVRLAELHGWDQSPSAGEVFTFRVSGMAATPSQHIELFAEPRGGSDISLRLLLDNYLKQPSLLFEARAASLPVTPLPGLLRNFGARIPDGLRLEGNLQGGVRYTTISGWAGDAQLRNAAIELRDVPPLRFGQVNLALSRGLARLEPAAMVSSDRKIGQVSANYSLADGSYGVDLSSQGGPLAGLLQKFPVADVPFLSYVKSGNWSGTLRYAASFAEPGKWTGSGSLTDAVAAVQAVSTPVRILNARVRLDGAAVQLDRMTLEAGKVVIAGEYRYVPSAINPHQFRLVAAEADLPELENLFRPVLVRRVDLIDLALTLGRVKPPPDWLRSLRADGTVQIGLLHAAGADLRKLRSRVEWRGTEVLLAGIQSRVTGAPLSGRVAIDVSKTYPEYSGAAKIDGVEWQSGSFGADMRFQTFGSGVAAVANLKVTGKFEGKGIDLSPLGTMDQIIGDYGLSFNAGNPRLQIPSILAVMDGQTWTGSGGSETIPGDILLTLTNKGKQINLAGSVTDPARAWVER